MRSGQFFKDFPFRSRGNLVFPTMAANDRGYGLGRAAGGFPVAMATKEMRAQRLLKAQ